MNIDKIETESIIKIPQTDKDVDNSALEFKQKCFFTDDYGVERFFYKKEVISAAQYKYKLQEKKAELSKGLEDITAEEAKIESLSSKPK